MNLHIYKTVKDIKTSFLTDIAAANVCIMKKTRGLYHVYERRYFNFTPGRFSEIVAILTAPAVCSSCDGVPLKFNIKICQSSSFAVQSFEPLLDPS